MNNVKVVLVGDGLVGKTCFLITMTTNFFPGSSLPNVRMDYSSSLVRNGKAYQRTTTPVRHARITREGCSHRYSILRNLNPNPKGCVV